MGKMYGFVTNFARKRTFACFTLNLEEIKKIVRLRFRNVQKMLQSDNIVIGISDSVIDWIANQGFDPQYGARPLKRLIQREILNELSKKILKNQINPKKEIFINLNENSLVF